MAAEKKKPGRKTKDTPDSREKFFGALRLSGRENYSCDVAGWSVKSLERYKRKEDFVALLKKARADFVMRNVSQIDAAAKISWQAAAWQLERFDPDTWGRKERLEHSGPSGGAIPVEVYLPDNGRDKK